MLEDLHQADFTAQVDTPFRLRFQDEAQELVLRQVVAHPAPPGHEIFSLYFLGPPQPFIPQAMYPFTHPVLGDFDLFIVPVGIHASGGIAYEAAFNRLPPAPPAG